MNQDARAPVPRRRTHFDLIPISRSEREPTLIPRLQIIACPATDSNSPLRAPARGLALVARGQSTCYICDFVRRLRDVLYARRTKRGSTSTAVGDRSNTTWRRPAICMGVGDTKEAALKRNSQIPQSPTPTSLPGRTGSPVSVALRSRIT